MSLNIWMQGFPVSEDKVKRSSNVRTKGVSQRTSKFHLEKCLKYGIFPTSEILISFKTYSLSRLPEPGNIHRDSYPPLRFGHCPIMEYSISDRIRRQPLPKNALR